LASVDNESKLVLKRLSGSYNEERSDRVGKGYVGLRRPLLTDDEPGMGMLDDELIPFEDESPDD
jgi:hypothetical protein